MPSVDKFSEAGPDSLIASCLVSRSGGSGGRHLCSISALARLIGNPVALFYYPLAMGGKHQFLNLMWSHHDIPARWSPFDTPAAK